MEDVFRAHRRAGFPLHPAYAGNGNTRVSCSACVLSSWHALSASLQDERNHEAHRRLVDLEIASGFSFQSNRWLGDTRPAILRGRQREDLVAAKIQAEARHRQEQKIPRELRFVAGTPAFVPDLPQCVGLAIVRRAVAALYGQEIPYTTAESVRARYAELFASRKLPAAGPAPPRRPK